MINIGKLLEWTNLRKTPADIEGIHFRESIFRYLLRLPMGLVVILLVAGILGLACHLTGILSFGDGFTGGLIGVTFGWIRLNHRKSYFIDSAGELSVSTGPKPLFGSPPPNETLLLLTEIQSYRLIWKKQEVELFFKRRLGNDVSLYLSVNRIDRELLMGVLLRQIGFEPEPVIGRSTLE